MERYELKIQSYGSISTISCMKHNKHGNHTTTAVDEPVAVRFDYTNADAQSVFVAGTFNNWQPTAKALHSAGGGRWLKDTTLIPGAYEYCLIVDGRWISDPRVEETVANPFGGRNSVLRVASTPEGQHLSDAEHLPLNTPTSTNPQIL